MCQQEVEHDQALCRELLATLSEYVDGELKPELCAELERHLRGCQRCRIVVDTLKKTVALYHEAAGEAPLPDDVRSRLFVKLNLEDFRKES